jgi:benzylsuccinate CoA-transferase BbsF subunit
VAAGVVQNGEDLVDRDPQLRHRHHFHALDHPELGSHICEVAPFRLSDSPAKPRRAPCLGEHTEFICRQFLGMSDEEFVGLMQAGAFG